MGKTQIIKTHKAEIKAKTISMHSLVTAINFSDTFGDFFFQSISSSGVLTIQKQSGYSDTFEVSPSEVIYHDTFHNNDSQKEYTLLCIDHDKYEAAVTLYHCVCDSTNCIHSKN